MAFKMAVGEYVRIEETIWSKLSHPHTAFTPSLGNYGPWQALDLERVGRISHIFEDSGLIAVNFGNGSIATFFEHYLEVVTDPVEIAAAKLVQGI